jgi:hypothetical protein
MRKGEERRAGVVVEVACGGEGVDIIEGLRFLRRLSFARTATSANLVAAARVPIASTITTTAAAAAAAAAAASRAAAAAVAGGGALAAPSGVGSVVGGVCVGGAALVQILFPSALSLLLRR